MSDNIPSNPQHPIDTAIRIGTVALLAGWCLYIAAPFIGAIAWGVIIAIGSYPLHRWIQRKTGLGNGWSATLLTVIMLAILIVPTILLSGALMEETRQLTTQVQAGKLKIPPPPEKVAQLPVVGEKLADIWQRASRDPKAVLGEFEPQLRAMAGWLAGATANIGLGILLFVFSIVIAGIFLAKADSGKRAAAAIFTRLTNDRKRGLQLTDLSRSTVRSVVNGILGIAIIQTLLAGLGFMAMGIPGAGVLALICLVLAVVQIDILIILIPLSIYGFTIAGTGAAIAFLVWNIAVGLMNNVLKPILLARGVQAPMAVIFVGAIGGLIAHGIIGLFVGAVVLVLGYTLFKLWLEEPPTVTDA